MLWRQILHCNFTGFREARVVRSVHFLEGRVRFPAIKTHSVPNLLARSSASGVQPIKTEKSNSAGARINRETRNKRWQESTGSSGTRNDRSYWQGIKGQQMTEVNREHRKKEWQELPWNLETRDDRRERRNKKWQELTGNPGTRDEDCVQRQPSPDQLTLTCFKKRVHKHLLLVQTPNT